MLRYTTISIATSSVRTMRNVSWPWPSTITTSAFTQTWHRVAPPTIVPTMWRSQTTQRCCRISPSAVEVHPTLFSLSYGFFPVSYLVLSSWFCLFHEFLLFCLVLDCSLTHVVFIFFHCLVYLFIASFVLFHFSCYFFPFPLNCLFRLVSVLYCFCFVWFLPIVLSVMSFKFSLSWRAQRD